MVTKIGVEQYIDLTNARTRYIEAGTGDSHFILLHGMGITNSADTFQFIIDDLAERFHVYSLDILGYGKGTRTIPEGPTFDLTVDHVREFMDAKGIEKATLMGLSAGGWVSGLFAYESPDRLNNLVMLSAAGLNAEISPGISNQALPNEEQAIAGVRRMIKHQDKLSDERIKLLSGYAMEMAAQPGALHSLDPIIHQMETWELRQRYLLHRRLPFIKVPTLVIWGQGDWMDPFPTWTEEYAKLGGDMTKSSKPWTIPGAKYVMLDTGHGAEWEDPELLVKVLLDFLKP